MLPWLVQRLGGEDVEVVALDSWHAAIGEIERGSVAAAVVSVTPARVEWRAFQHACASRQPLVPVLYESCLHSGPGDLGLEPLEGSAAFLAKPASRIELEGALQRLLAEATAVPDGPSGEAGSADSSPAPRDIPHPERRKSTGRISGELSLNASKRS